MPELPEVETICRDLRVIEGATIAGVEIDWPGSIGSPKAETFAQATAGFRVDQVRRRAKYILLIEGDARVIAVHLRMTGRLLLRTAGMPRELHQRVALSLTDGHRLIFTDLRKFGRLYLFDHDALSTAPRFLQLGPEPLEDSFTVGDLAKALERRTAAVKGVLLDQRAVAGLGNIYADESLFAAGIHPLRSATALSDEERQRLHHAIRAVLQSAVNNRGTTMRDYVDAQGFGGLNQHSLSVYRRTGHPCRACSATIQRIVVAGRGTHFCPTCQPSNGCAPC